LTTWCVDANVVLAIYLEDQATDSARGFLTGLEASDEVIGPQILLPECTSVLRRKVSQGVLSEDQGRRFLESVLAFPIAIETSQDQFRLAIAWAFQMNRTRMHDLQYIAVAQIRNATVVTIDGGLSQAATERGVPVRVLQ
jgi:predicted nucleic acid-binding protein